jgi:hypothetical protein
MFTAIDTDPVRDPHDPHPTARRRPRAVPIPGVPTRIRN